MAKQSEHDPAINNRLVLFIEKYVTKRQLDLVDIVGLSQANISTVLSGKRAPSTRFLIPLVEKYQLNIEWLTTGEGNEKVDVTLKNGRSKTIGDLTAELAMMKKVQRVMEVQQQHLFLAMGELTETVKELKAEVEELKAKQ